MPKIIAIDGIIGIDVTVNGIRNDIQAAKGEDITFEISSPGGFVAPGIAIFNLIKNIPQKTTARIIGLAASMASIIPLAADTVIAESMSIFMIHNSQGITAGDRHDHAKRISIMSGMDKMMANVFAQKTGKSIKEIGLLMDAETFFFGDDIKEAGFVDETIEAEKQEDREEALAFANLQIENCFDELKNSEPEDLGKIAALLDIKNIKASSIIKPTQPKATTPAAANQNPNPKVKMDLQQHLTENPASQKELDSMIATAKTEATATLQAKIDKVVPFIGNTNYPGIASMCSKVLKNESEFSTLEGAVTAFDMIKEQTNSTDATAETEDKGETKAEETTTSTDGMVNSDQDMDAIVKKHKQQIQG